MEFNMKPNWNQPQGVKLKASQFESIKDNFAAWIVGNRCKDLSISINASLFVWVRNRLDYMILGDVLESIEESKDEGLVIQIMRQSNIHDDIIRIFTFNNYPSSSYGNLHPHMFFGRTK
tara:strand:- start:44 stop:400 length:357 start_codon:yes stop_codon:yes gene_type:complete